MFDRVVIHDVGMRDGLQMEKTAVPFEMKVQWIDRLIAAGVSMIQVGSFVHPEKVPTMADTDKLFAEFQKPGRKPDGVILSGLVLNDKGLDRGAAVGVDMYCMGVSASETHSMKNTGKSIKDATDTILGMAAKARTMGKRVQLSVQSAFGCGFEGPIAEAQVLSIVDRYLEAGFTNISLADTAGHATPDRIERLFRAVLKKAPTAECACHIHNTYGIGMANCLAAMNAGVKFVETSLAGIGGCPFTKVAGGNVATEDFVHMMQAMGAAQGIKLDQLITLAKDVGQFFNREMPGVVHRVGVIPQQRPS